MLLLSSSLSWISQVPTFTLLTCHTLGPRGGRNYLNNFDVVFAKIIVARPSPLHSISFGAVLLKGVIPPNGLLTPCLRFTTSVTLIAQDSVQGFFSTYTGFSITFIKEFTLVRLIDNTYLPLTSKRQLRLAHMIIINNSFLY